MCWRTLHTQQWVQRWQVNWYFTLTYESCNYNLATTSKNYLGECSDIVASSTRSCLLATKFVQVQFQPGAMSGFSSLLVLVPVSRVIRASGLVVFLSKKKPVCAVCCSYSRLRIEVCDCYFLMVTVLFLRNAKLYQIWVHVNLPLAQMCIRSSHQ